jgi:acyl-CoA thioester hydrolase
MTTLPITYRSVVNAWDCDIWGHQNVEHYLAKAGDAQAALCRELGLTPSWLRERGAAVRQVRDRVLFKRELHSGDPVAIHSGVRDAQGSAIRYFSVMSNHETGHASAVFETEARLVDIATGEPIELPADVMTRARALAAASNDHPPPAPIDEPRAPAVTPQHAILTHRTAVGSHEYDESGCTPPRYHIARFGAAATQLIEHLGLAKSELLERKVGSAALDYLIEYRAPLRPGQAVDIRSGMLDVRGKVFRCFHHLIAEGEVATSIEVVIVFFDLVARKSVSMPAEIVDRARELMARTANG